ncbi:MAG: LacI family DNA-binding transcriptional regulator [Actinomycetales bacterium]|nr:LacI family DNA-binding transcriptional regulator [Actinomycetales bacterium]
MMDVARLAGVSHQTVSRVLNGHAKVRQQTRQRVLDAMRELDYQPNSAARMLVTRRSNTLGIVTFDSTLFGPSSMVYGIEQAARAAGYFVTIASSRSLSRSSVLEAVNRLREQAVEGIVAIVPKDSAVDALASVPAGIALVGVGVGGAADVPMVGVDNTAGAELAVHHLLDLGHRTVHHVSGPAGWPEARERVAGWQKALAEAGAAEPEVLVGDWSARSGYQAGQAVARDPEATAVFCGNDQMALGVLRALSEVGRRVPDDVSVVGFDDIPEAPYLIPPLTTVRQDFGEVGRRSMELLLRIAEGEQSHHRIHLTPRLVVRTSAARPAS